MFRRAEGDPGFEFAEHGKTIEVPLKEQAGLDREMLSTQSTTAIAGGKISSQLKSQPAVAVFDQGVLDSRPDISQAGVIGVYVGSMIRNGSSTNADMPGVNAYSRYSSTSW